MGAFYQDQADAIAEAAFKAGYHLEDAEEREDEEELEDEVTPEEEVGIRRQCFKHRIFYGFCDSDLVDLTQWVDFEALVDRILTYEYHKMFNEYSFLSKAKLSDGDINLIIDASKILKNVSTLAHQIYKEADYSVEDIESNCHLHHLVESILKILNESKDLILNAASRLKKVYYKAPSLDELFKLADLAWGLVYKA